MRRPGIKHIEPSRLFSVLEVGIKLTRNEQTHLAICDDCREVFAVFETYIAEDVASDDGRLFAQRRARKALRRGRRRQN